MAQKARRELNLLSAGLEHFACCGYSEHLQDCLILEWEQFECIAGFADSDFGSFEQREELSMAGH